MRILTRKETAQTLTVSMMTLYRLEKAGKMPPRIQITDKRVGYRDSDVERFINERIGEDQGKLLDGTL